jgi:hypothetical protein
MTEWASVISGLYLLYKLCADPSTILQKCCLEMAGEKRSAPEVSAEFGFITRVFILMVTLFFSRKKLSSNYLISLFLLSRGILWGILLQSLQIAGK